MRRTEPVEWTVKTKQMPNSSCGAAIDQRRASLTLLAVVLLFPLGCRHADSSANSSSASTSHGEVSRQTADDPAQELKSAVETRDWNRALQVAPEAMIASPDDPNVLTNAAIATANAGRRVEAAQLLVDAARASEYAPGIRIDNAFRALLDVGRLHDAIDLLENVLERDPDAFMYRRRLVGFLGEAQLIEQVDVHLSHLIRDRKFDLPLLLATTESNSRRYSPKTIEALLEKNPRDLRPRLGQAKAFLGSRNAKAAEQVLREILDRHPDLRRRTQCWAWP